MVGNLARLSRWRAFASLTSRVQTVQRTPEGVIKVPYDALKLTPSALRSSIEEAFGSKTEALGIIVVSDLPADYVAKREKLLRMADRFASMSKSKKEKYADEKSRFSFGWSHGKEIMNGKPDFLKGSFYANPLVDLPVVNDEAKKAYPEYYGSNIWPVEDEVEGFEIAFKDLGQFVYSVGRELAIACQPFAAEHLTDQSVGLADLISRQTTKARLLRYFPPSPAAPLPAENEPVDSWCGFHLDHSLLTGLCSAMFLSHEPGNEPTAVQSPSPLSGLYIRSRGGTLTKVSIPFDCLAFQTGQALELATGGRLRATPHCVRVGAGEGADHVSRETFALFMQPETSQLIGPDETFGQFSKRIFDEHYEPPALQAEA